MFRYLAPFFSDLWRQRQLLWQFTQRSVELRHKGSHLGLVWSILSPLLILGLYMLVFGKFNGNRFGVLPNETTTDYGLGVFLSLTIFHFISEVLAVSPSLITSNPNFVKKVVFPLEILPAASVGGAAFHMVISLGLVVCGIQFIGRGLHVGILWLPFILLPLFFLCLGIAWSVSAVGVFFRDIGQLTQFATLGLMFASCLFYPASRVHGTAWTILRFNPVLLAVELARNAALWDRPLNFKHLSYLWLVSLLACTLGYAFFKRTKSAFADVV
jgi:lipopolysaccharide transport system permease protein